VGGRSLRLSTRAVTLRKLCNMRRNQIANLVQDGKVRSLGLGVFFLFIPALWQGKTAQSSAFFQKIMR